jgi:hypothetical protein
MLGLPNRLKMIDPLSLPDTGQNHAFFVEPVLWNNQGDGLANRLFCRVVEEALRTPIPAGDDAVQVLAYNRIITGLDDGANPAQALFTFAKRRFDLLALGDFDTSRMQESPRSARGHRLTSMEALREKRTRQPLDPWQSESLL